MTTISFSSNSTNDLHLAATGNIAMAVDLEAVLQNCKTAMQAQMFEMIYAYESGMPNRSTAYERYNPVQFEAAGRATLSAVEGVLGVEAFAVDRVGTVLVYTATIATIYGSTNLNG